MSNPPPPKIVFTISICLEILVSSFPRIYREVLTSLLFEKNSTLWPLKTNVKSSTVGIGSYNWHYDVCVAAYLVVRKPKNVTMPTLMIDIIMINITARWTFSFNKTTNDFIHHFTFIPHGLIRTQTWPALNVSGFIAQLVQTPLKTWNLQASARNCTNCFHNCEDHSLIRQQNYRSDWSKTHTSHDKC